MASSSKPTHEETVAPYVCTVSGATFTKRCTVGTCFANVDNLNQAGVDVQAVSGCAYVDFHLAGFPENLDYAVVEQGFVGYRDLQYIAPFLNTPPIKLRDIYTNNIEYFKRSVAILWALKNNGTGNYCQHCGHPIPSAIRCTSVTMCEERRMAAYQVLEPFNSLMPTEEDLVKAMNAVWKSVLSDKHNPRIPLSEKELFNLNDLRINA